MEIDCCEEWIDTNAGSEPVTKGNTYSTPAKQEI